MGFDWHNDLEFVDEAKAVVIFGTVYKLSEKG